MPDQTVIRRSACPYDCPDTCGLLVEVAGDRVVGVRGDPDHPVTRGFLCRKMSHYERSINHPKRLLRPMKRVGPKGEARFAALSWDEALDTIASRWKAILASDGAEAILPYSYSGVMSAIGRHGGIAFFNKLGGSGLIRTLCSAGKGAGWAALMGGSADLDPREMTRSTFILIWGSDVPATRLHCMPDIQAARQRGVPVVLIETYASPASALADETILVNPGSDGALALAMMQVLVAEGLADRDFLDAHTVGWREFEPTLADYTPEAVSGVVGLSAEAIRDLARRYGRAAAPVILFGSGPSRRRNGAMNCRCVALLPAVVGAWAKPGGGTVGFGPAPSPVNGAVITRPDFLEQPVRNINCNCLAATLADATLAPPVRSLYVYGSNPAAVVGNQQALLRQLGRDDLFTVVHERFMTDTARYADIVLPATFSVEQADIHTCYGYRTLMISRAAVPPPGECRSNWNTFRALAGMLGLDDPYFRRTEEEMVEHVLENSPALRTMLDDAGWAALREGRAVDLQVEAPPVFKTASGKIEILNPALDEPLPRYLPVEEDPYPLRLVAAPSAHTLNSTFTEREDLVAARGPQTLRMSEHDAAARGIRDGDEILCCNELAEVRCIATIADVKPGTVVSVGVFSAKAAPGGLTANALVRERISDLGEATTLNDNGVEVRPFTA
ncbi:MAG: molybdopterin-dependent oxidoreductase [Planctomycetaceae bacterium]|nr:molybdopterin-dependent oxidoreductase [Planctomycetaceae bacterium]